MSEWDGWIAAVIPGGARRFRVDEDGLAATLAAAGGELVDEQPDVEIGAADTLRGDAACAVVPISPTLPEGDRRLVRAARRVAAYARASFAATRARRALLRRGYGGISIVRWDIEQLLRRPGPDRRPRLRAAERLAGGAVVVGTRGSAGPTVLDEAGAAAARAVGLPRIDTRWPTVRGSGVLVTRDEERVLRVGVGPERQEIRRHCGALELLAAAAPPAAVADRAPRVEAHGETGLAYWSLERRLAGEEPRALDAGLKLDCVEFLVALHPCGGGTQDQSLVASAEIVGRHCAPHSADGLVALAARLEAALAGLPRGFGHGDFWHGNLLVDGGRLRGVVDWAAAGPGRLPLLDVLGLLVGERGSRYFGRTLHDYLLPWARAGGDDLSRDYCRRLDLDVGAAELEALAIAYWLDRAARELETYADRVRRPAWLRANVLDVVPALTK